PLQEDRAARRRERLHGGAEGARPPRAQRVPEGPGGALPPRRGAGPERRHEADRARLRQGDRRHACRRSRDQLQGGDRDRPLRRAQEGGREASGRGGGGEAAQPDALARLRAARRPLAELKDEVAIAREGWPVIGTAAGVLGLVGAVGALAGHPAALVPLVLAVGFCFYFFRDPERRAPPDERLVV